ncbi:MAG: carbohydrate-binding domain-containing protein [Candidatus Hodarchaeales archaeon]
MANQITRFNKIFIFLLILFLSFPQKALSEQNTIYIDCKKTYHKISSFLFGTNLEWINKCQNLWDPEYNNINTQAEEIINSLYIPLIRFPGGTLTDFYTWYHAIGDYNQRTYIYDQYKRLFFPYFGTEEFYKFLSYKNAEGIISVNFMRGTSKEAAEWVEYCNGDENTYWGKIRASNGYKNPFNIQFWQIGNEPYLGYCDVFTYADIVAEYSHAMKEVDDKIKIIATGAPYAYQKDIISGREWNRTLLELVGDKIDILSTHFYGPASDNITINFYCNSSKTFSFNITNSDNVSFNILAAGTPCDSIFPKMVCQVDCFEKHEFYVNSEEYNCYSFSAILEPGEHQLKISFVNDAYKPPQDRNLFIKKIEINSPYSDIKDFVEDAFFKSILIFPTRMDKNIGNFKELLNNVFTKPDIKLAITEYNAYYYNFSHLHDLKTALLIGNLLHIYMKNNIFMANFWLLSGEPFGCVCFKENSFIKRPTYYVLDLLSRHRERIFVETNVDSSEFSYNGYSSKYLSTICTIDENRETMYLSVINNNYINSLSAEIIIANFEPTKKAIVYTLTAPSLNSNNETDGENIKVNKTIINNVWNKFNYDFPPRSITFFEIKAKKRGIKKRRGKDVITAVR